MIRWPEFQRLFLRAHKQGEHVSIVGPTGSGKSVVGLELCKLVGSRRGARHRPARVVVLATKPRDDTLKKSLSGWPIIKKWPPSYGEEHSIVWPRPSKASDRAVRQAAVFGPLLDAIYHEGEQTVYIDEAAYFERPLPKGLGLAATMEEFWTSARGSKLTLIAGTQRPRHVTRSMWSEPSWVIVFRPEDEEDLKRVAQLSGMKDRVMVAADYLHGHEFLVVRRQRGGARELYASKVGT